jgi:uncharacterized protein
MDLERKEQALSEFIGRYPSAIVAFSGGVDSSYLAFMCHRILGPHARVVTAISPSVSERQKALVSDFVARYGLNHTTITGREMEDPNYTSNPVNRCYFCKSGLFVHLRRLKQEWGMDVVFDGSNRDDMGDYRPGRDAAGESEVVSPFVEVGLSKEEIRRLSQKNGLPSWDLPAMPCLSSRFPYGVEITEEKLRQVDKAERFLRDLGLKNFRVRHHDTLARIEIDRAEMPGILDMNLLDAIQREFQALGYHYVTLDLKGFRSGSLNELLHLKKVTE